MDLDDNETKMRENSPSPPASKKVQPGGRNNARVNPGNAFAANPGNLRPSGTFGNGRGGGGGGATENNNGDGVCFALWKKGVYQTINWNELKAKFPKDANNKEQFWVHYEMIQKGILDRFSDLFMAMGIKKWRNIPMWKKEFDKLEKLASDAIKVVHFGNEYESFKERIWVAMEKMMIMYQLMAKLEYEVICYEKEMLLYKNCNQND